MYTVQVGVWLSQALQLFDVVALVVAPGAGAVFLRINAGPGVWPWAARERLVHSFKKITVTFRGLRMELAVVIKLIVDAITEFSMQAQQYVPGSSLRLMQLQTRHIVHALIRSATMVLFTSSCGCIYLPLSCKHFCILVAFLNHSYAWPAPVLDSY